GPIGLEAALAAEERGWSFDIYEAGDAPAAHVRDWGHVRLFTPWSMNVSPRARAAFGGRTPGGDRIPTGHELAAGLIDPLASLPTITPRLRLGRRVVAVSRQGLLKHEEIGTGRRRSHPFRLLVAGPGGEEAVEHADAVLDCTGTYGNPNALGDGGIPAPGERAFSPSITRRLPRFADDPGMWAGRRILLTGAGHSAQTAAGQLAAFARDAPGTRVTWAVRAPEPGWGAVPNDPLPERAGLNATARQLAGGASDAVEVLPGHVTEALRGGPGGAVTVSLRNGGLAEIEVDRVLALNGGVGDFGIYRQLQVHECYATAGPMKLAAALLGESGGDCLAQAAHGAETLENPEPGFFILGAKSYGRNSQFLLRVGWEQVRDVFGLLESQRS
ncbi:MAG: hypothetical protein ACR2K9_00310, partial [Solirubrobacteraceae bacterium]